MWHRGCWTPLWSRLKSFTILDGLFLVTQKNINTLEYKYMRSISVSINCNLCHQSLIWVLMMKLTLTETVQSSSYHSVLLHVSAAWFVRKNNIKNKSQFEQELEVACNNV